MPALPEMMVRGDRPVLGCFPLYPPLELFHSMGLAPVVLWGLRDAIPLPSLAGRHLQSFVCSVARRLTEAVLTDPGVLDGLYVENACDTLRNLPEILEQGMPRALPVFRMHVPAGSAAPAVSSGYTRARIDELIRSLSAAFEDRVTFSADRFIESVGLYREMRRLSLEAERRVAEGAASFRALQDIALAGAFAPVERQIEALRSFPSRRRPAGHGPGYGVVLSGILPPPGAVTDVIEGAGLTVVANDIALMHRSWAYTPTDAADPGDYYADCHLNRFPCTTALRTSDRRVDTVEGMVRRSGARGLIFIGEKFCECEHLEMPYLEGRLRRAGVRTLTLEIPPDGEPLAQMRTRVETFTEMLEQS